MKTITVTTTYPNGIVETKALNVFDGKFNSAMETLNDQKFRAEQRGEKMEIDVK